MPALFSLDAHAKLNLFLHVTGKRADGYHTLHSLVSFLNFADKISFLPQTETQPKISMSGPFAPTLKNLNDADNLAMKAAQICAQKAGKNFDMDIHIEKKIPPGAGLGGGSADAAAVIRGLFQHWNIQISPPDLQNMLLSLGADIPACFEQKTLFMEGIGEIIKEGPSLPDIPFVLVYPNVPSDTAAVYKNLSSLVDHSQETPPETLTSLNTLVDYLDHTKNDLAAPATALCPEIDLVLNAIAAQSGVRLARMSGSGSSCFGIFETHEKAQNAAEIITFDNPQWWCQATAPLL